MQQQQQYEHETLETVQKWITPIGGMEHWMIYGGPCEKCPLYGRDSGTLWMWTEGQIMMGVALCDECNGSKTWNIGIEDSDWMLWALEAIAGRRGQQQIAYADPPSMLQHMIIP